QGSRTAVAPCSLRRLLVALPDFVPVSIHLLKRGFRTGFALLFQPRFDVAETAAEFAIGGLECHLRFDPELARDVRSHEQKITDLFGNRLLIAFRSRNFRAQ